jgi:hypothetical protein
MKGRYNPGPYHQSTFTATAGSPQGLPNLFPVQIGNDVTGVFAMSLYGLAVIRPDSRLVVHREGDLLDVTAFLLPGVDPGVFRIPVPEVFPGELIVTSDSPLSLLYVLERTEAGVRGLDPFTGNIVRYIAPLNPFFNYFVRLQSLFGLLFAETGEIEEEIGEDERRDRDDRFPSFLLPLLLLGFQGQNTSLITLVLLMQLLGRRP